MNIETFPGYVIWLRSSNSKKEFPAIVFSADVDFVTNGLVSLTSITDNEIVVTEQTDQEYSSNDPRASEARVNRELIRSDLRCVHWVRTDEKVKPGMFESFQRYLKRSLRNPSEYFYTDITSAGGEALQVRKESLQDFIKGGGKFRFHKMTT